MSPRKLASPNLNGRTSANSCWQPSTVFSSDQFPIQFDFDTNHHYLHFAARDAELDQLKTLVKQLADKVNAPGNAPAERLAAVEDRVDEVAVHGIHLGTTLGLAAMATHTGVDYSIQPRGFQGGAPEDLDEIQVILERLDGHGDAIAELTHPQSVLNRLFD
jgi:hypothetical protein